MLCSFNLFFSKMRTSASLFWLFIIWLFMKNVFIHNSVDVFRITQFCFVLFHLSVIFQQVSFNLFLLSKRKLRDIRDVRFHIKLFLSIFIENFRRWCFLISISFIIKLTKRVIFLNFNHFFKTLFVKLWSRLIIKIYTFRKLSSTSFKTIRYQWPISFKLHF